MEGASRPFSILTFNCEHLLFVQYKTITNESSRIFQIFFRAVLNFTKIKSVWIQVFVILSIHKPSLGSCEVPHKIWARSVQPFWRLLDSNRSDRQTARQAKYIEVDRRLNFWPSENHKPINSEDSFTANFLTPLPFKFSDLMKFIYNKALPSYIYLYLYKVVISVCLFVCPIITEEPLDRWGTRETQGNVLSLVLRF